MPRKLYKGICRNCGGHVEKVYRSHGITTQTCPLCGYISVYPYDLTGPMESEQAPAQEPKQEPAPALINKPAPHLGRKPVKRS